MKQLGAYVYSIVQVVPDAIRDERLNVGVVVVAVDDSATAARWLPRSDSGRLNVLGGTGLYDAVAAIASSFRSSPNRAAPNQIALPGGDRMWSIAELDRAATSWEQSIRLTSPRRALHSSAAKLADELYERSVRPAGRRQALRARTGDKRHVRQRVTRRLRAQVAVMLPDVVPAEAVRTRIAIPGSLESHRFDIAIHNGMPKHLIQTFSFEVRATPAFKKEIDAVSWAIDDVRKTKKAPPISVAVTGSNALLETAVHTYRELGAEVILERDLDGWLDALGGSLPELLAHA